MPVVAPLTPKGRKKVIQTFAPTKASAIPEKWPDFARLTRIRSGSKVIPFDPYFYQEELIEIVKNNYGTVVLKGRQLGATEVISSYLLWRAAKEPGFLGVVLSKGQIDTSNIAMRIRGMAQSVPDLIDLDTKNLTDLRVNGGGRVVFRPSTPNGIRGLESVSCILLDELAFISDIENLYSAALPSTELCGPDARIILLSTPNGRSGFFFDRLNSNNGDINLIDEVEKVRTPGSRGFHHWVDRTGWAKVLIGWRAHPIYSADPNYIETLKERKQLSEIAVRQEYDLELTTSEANFFSSEAIRQCADGFWETPQPRSNYYMGVDTSAGGSDYTVALVGKYHAGALHIVDMYRERKKTLDYNLAKIGEMIEKYDPAIVGVEKNGAGQLYIEQLSKVHKSTRIEALLTTKESKLEMMTRLLYVMEIKKVSYPPSIIVDELTSFHRVGERLEAVSGTHDDTVMALAMAVSVSPVKTRKGTYDLSF